MSPYGKCTVDVTGKLVTQQSGKPFYASWVGLPLLINGVYLPSAPGQPPLLPTVVSVQDAGHLTLSDSVGQWVNPVPFGPVRETVYQAFFNRIKSAGAPIQTFSRVPQIFDNIDPAMMPFMFIEQRGESAARPGAGVPYNWHFDVAMGIVASSPDPLNLPPVTILNPILDAIEAALPPSPTVGQQTLDGIVYEARLFGNGLEAAGAIGNIAWAYVPARIFTT